MAIRSFYDLEIYQESFDLMVIIFEKILPYLPNNEYLDLVNQLKRSSKAVPRLIAEGYSKKGDLKVFKKYLRDALGENNETLASLEQCRKLYTERIDIKILNNLINKYNKIGKQIYTTEKTWI